jgi:hypothetical protein
VRKKEGVDVEVFTALSQTVETGTKRVSFDVISTLNSQLSTLASFHHTKGFLV